MFLKGCRPRRAAPFAFPAAWSRSLYRLATSGLHRLTLGSARCEPSIDFILGPSSGIGSQKNAAGKAALFDPPVEGGAVFDDATIARSSKRRYLIICATV